MKTFKTAAKVFMALAYVVAGLNHFIHPRFYLSIMPPYLPWHLGLVYVSGIAEVFLGLLLLVPKTSRLAAWGIIALLIAVFPANIHLALHPEIVPTLNPVWFWLR